MRKNVLVTFLLFLTILISNAIGQEKPVIEWVDIPAGTFKMGSPSDEPKRKDDEIQHQVTLNAFKMSKYEVTFAQYDLFCDATNREKPEDEGWGRANRPVINVSWEDAKAFAEWLGCRLPTEAEWEYACRAGSTTPYYTGDNITTKQANYYWEKYDTEKDGVYREMTTPVGSFAPNNYGLYDMVGNVNEWCSDWYAEYSNSSQNNPKGPANGEKRVERGGNWDERPLRSADRSQTKPEARYDCIGFRLVSDN